MTLRALILAALFAWAGAAGAQAPEKPNVLALVIGIEHYKEPVLDQLEYAADDARKIYEQLAVVANLVPGSRLHVSDDGNKNLIGASEVRRIVDAFTRKITDNSNVVIYMGGHGIVSPGNQLWFIPSDYDSFAEENYYSFSELFEAIDNGVKRDKKTGVHVTFLLNTCGSGNARPPVWRGMNVAEAQRREEREAFRSYLQRTLDSFGEWDHSIIPATAPDKNAYELDALKASQYAYHLLDGLRGAAADSEGSLTVESILGYLQEKLGNDITALNIRHGKRKIGITRPAEGEASLVLGSTLLGAALAARQPVEEGTARPVLAPHADALLDLAIDQLARVPARHPELGLARSFA